VWKKADADEKEFARQDLAGLSRKASSGLIDLVYGDQGGI